MAKNGDDSADVIANSSADHTIANGYSALLRNQQDLIDQIHSQESSEISVAENGDYLDASTEHTIPNGYADRTISEQAESLRPENVQQNTDGAAIPRPPQPPPPPVIEHRESSNPPPGTSAFYQLEGEYHKLVGESQKILSKLSPNIDVMDELPVIIFPQINANQQNEAESSQHRIPLHLTLPESHKDPIGTAMEAFEKAMSSLREKVSQIANDNEAERKNMNDRQQEQIRQHASYEPHLLEICKMWFFAGVLTGKYLEQKPEGNN